MKGESVGTVTAFITAYGEAVHWSATCAGIRDGPAKAVAEGKGISRPQSIKLDEALARVADYAWCACPP